MEVNVRNKILYLIQAWAHAFRNEPKYKVVQDTYQIMKVEGELGLVRTLYKARSTAPEATGPPCWAVMPAGPRDAGRKKEDRRVLTE